MRVVIRDFDHDRDIGFIYSTWAKSVYYGSAIDDDKDPWFKEFYKKMSLACGSNRVLIASLEESPDTIFGYAILDGSTCEFVYVKEVYRRQGIAALLLKDQPITSFNCCTQLGTKIIAKRVFNGKKETSDAVRHGEGNQG